MPFDAASQPSDLGSDRSQQSPLLPNRLRWLLLLLLAGAVFQLPAQQTDVYRKLLADTRANAQRGDAQSQFESGRAFFERSLGVVKDHAEAVERYRSAAEPDNANPQRSLSCYCYNGQGVAKAKIGAVRSFRKAAWPGRREGHRRGGGAVSQSRRAELGLRSVQSGRLLSQRPRRGRAPGRGRMRRTGCWAPPATARPPTRSDAASGRCANAAASSASCPGSIIRAGGPQRRRTFRSSVSQAQSILAGDSLGQ